MQSFRYEDWAGPAAGLVGLLGASWVVWRTVRPPTPRSARKAKRGGKALEYPCSVCGHQMVFMRSEMTPVSATSKGLIVRSHPAVASRKLAEFTCPSCEASHCFIVEGKAPQWVGANLYQPGGGSLRCMECNKPVRKPPWPRGLFDEKIERAPHVGPETAMLCTRCQAVVCHECAARTSFGRLTDGAYRCPRCTRIGVSAFYHG